MWGRVLKQNDVLVGLRLEIKIHVTDVLRNSVNYVSGYPNSNGKFPMANKDVNGNIGFSIWYFSRPACLKTVIIDNLDRVET